MNIVNQIIKEGESLMPKCYTEKRYREVLANRICDRHIALLKQRRADERNSHNS